MLVNLFHSTKMIRSARCAERKRSETRTTRVEYVPVSTTLRVWRSVASVGLPIWMQPPKPWATKGGAVSTVWVSPYGWTRRLSTFLSLSVCLCLSLSVCLCLSVCLSVCLSLSLSHTHTHTHTHTLSLSLSVFVFVSVCLSLSASVCLFVCLSVCLSLSVFDDCKSELSFFG